MVNISSHPPKMWLGVICLLTGVFLGLVFFNIIPSQEAAFAYGRLPILFFSMAFAAVGLYVILYNVKPGIAKTPVSKVFLSIFSASLLIPFHIIIYRAYSEAGSLYEFVAGNWFLIFIVAIFDLIFIYAATYYFYKKLKEK